MRSNHLILCCPLLLPPSIFPSIRVFSNESALHIRWPKNWTIKKAERRRMDAFELWCWRRLLRVSWTARRSKQSILKEISPGCSLEGLMLKLKLQYFGHLVQRVSLLRIIHRALLLFIQPPPPLWFSGQWPDEVEKGYKSLDGL